ncbi:hypothetical protein OJ252_2505 [Cryptosporidium canis]|uniref:Uncharacterized protein n=1 Tax=Cryptosporidium canis TaxID=195482 RepID=A0ABQ8P4Y2_9CRYT|nr:hypothetical protein OJ252_2505 [Cryptosporidium canis]
MGRKKTQPVRYGGSEVYVDGFEGSVWGLGGREGDGSDGEVDLGAEDAGSGLGGEEEGVAGLLFGDLVECEDGCGGEGSAGLCGESGSLEGPEEGVLGCSSGLRGERSGMEAGACWVEVGSDGAV